MTNESTSITSEIADQSGEDAYNNESNLLMSALMSSHPACSSAVIDPSAFVPFTESFKANMVFDVFEVKW